VDGLLDRLPEIENLGVSVVLVGNGPPPAMAAFARNMSQEGRRVTVVTDPSLASYRAAGLKRPRMHGLRAAIEMFQALGQGYRQRRRGGDRLQLGGAFLVDDAGRVVYHHRSKSPGDLADPNDIVQAVLALLVERRAAGRRV
jgi:AhpC/TSA antioxidant enzyme